MDYKQQLTKDEIYCARSKFYTQKIHAKERNIPFLIPFDDWINWWLKTGHWYERGCKSGQYVMCRKGDVGPYTLDNIFCDTANKNVSTAAHRKKTYISLDPKYFLSLFKRPDTDNWQTRFKIDNQWYMLTTKKKDINEASQFAKEALEKYKSSPLSNPAKPRLRNKRPSKQKVAKPVQTPDGIFPTRTDAAKHYGVTAPAIGGRMRRNPTQYYYL